MNTATLRIGRYVLIGLMLQLPAWAGDSGLPPCPAGLIEGPDPIGRACEPRDKDKTTNAMQGRPETGHDAGGSPFMAWEDGEDGVHDIAFKIWTDGDWSSTEYLATSPADERDPRAFAAQDGTILVSWWAEGGRDAGVYYARRDPLTGDWSPGLRVAPAGRAPSIAIVSGRVLIVFERVHPTGIVDLVAVTERDGQWTQQVVRAAAGFGSLTSRVHHERNRTWVEWASSAREMDWSELVAGRWTRPQAIAMQDRSWQSEQSARERVRETVLAH